MTVLESGRLLLAEAIDLGRDAMHISVGLAVMLLVAIAMKRPLSDWRPIAAVAAASLAGTAWQAIDTYSHGGTPRWDADWKATLTMLFWPALLFALARFTKVLKR